MYLHFQGEKDLLRDFPRLFKTIIKIKKKNKSKGAYTLLILEMKNIH